MNDFLILRVRDTHTEPQREVSHWIWLDIPKNSKPTTKPATNKRTKHLTKNKINQKTKNNGPTTNKPKSRYKNIDRKSDTHKKLI